MAVLLNPLVIDEILDAKHSFHVALTSRFGPPETIVILVPLMYSQRNTPHKKLYERMAVGFRREGYVYHTSFPPGNPEPWGMVFKRKTQNLSTGF